MEDRQIFLDMLRSLEFDTMQGLWDFVENTIQLTLQSFAKNLARKRMGYTNTALTMLVHFAPPCC